MRSFLSVALVALLAVACGDDETTAPSPADGLEFSVQVQQNVTFLTMIVQITNSSSSTITRDISLACPIGIIFLNPQSSVAAYDESDRECASTATTSLRIEAGQTVTVNSGQRYIPTITATTPPSTYRIQAIIRFTDDEVLVSGSTYRLPNCVEVGVQTICE